MDNYLNRVLGGRYEIRELIGVGGMAIVYKAYDQIDKRTVAVKILKEEYLANDEFRNRFRNESKAIAVLSHPNIVKVFDVSFGDSLQYIVMEYVEGITLKEYIQRQRIVEWKEAVHFVVQILRALQHAHDKGIIHRDIKPQNILLLPNASIKVTDFGIARFNRGEIKSVADSSAIGSVHYVSPEQARGDYTDEKTDIYSVGIVLYEMLTGRLPFESDSDESVALMHLTDDAVRPSEINASIPVGLEQITVRAMQKNPADRYQSAAEFLLDLDEFKRNPHIKFDYMFYIDKTPTKYIGPSSDALDQGASGRYRSDRPTEEPAPRRQTKSRREEEYYDDYDDEEEEYTSRNITLPILVIIAVILVFVVGFIVFAAFGDTIREVVTGEAPVAEEASESFMDKLDIFGWFNKDKIEVPNLLNMNIDEAIEKYPDLIFEDPPQYEYNSTYEDGHICAQTPEAGSKVSSNTVIKITVATSGGMVQIRNVTGLSTKEAESVLTDSGLEVILVAQVDETKDEGEVLYTNPKANTYCPRNEIVYVYYASSVENLNSLRTPSVIGYELAAAKAKIEAAGIYVGSVTEGASAAAMKGLVISQSPDGLTPITAGATVNLVVGTGIPSANTVQVNIKLPDMSDDTTATVRTFLNNNAYDSISDVLLDGGSYSVSFTGTGASNPFKIFIDSVLIYSGNIDFTTSPPTISDLRQYEFAEKEIVPNVTGKEYTEAIDILSEAHFDRVHTRYEASDSVEPGIVITQSPEGGGSKTYSTDTVITLNISLGQEEAEDETVAEAQQTEAEIPADAPSEEAAPVGDVIPAEAG